jgi:hypothetical protein
MYLLSQGFLTDDNVFAHAIFSDSDKTGQWDKYDAPDDNFETIIWVSTAIPSRHDWMYFEKDRQLLLPDVGNEAKNQR